MYIYWRSKMIFLPKTEQLQLSRVESFADRMLSPLCLLVHYLCEPFLGGFKQNSVQGGRVFTFTTGNIFAHPRKDIFSKKMNPVYMHMHFPFHGHIVDYFGFCRQKVGNN